MAAPLQNSSRNFLASGPARSGRGTGISSSEAERLQYAFGSTTWVTYLFVATVVGSYAAADSLVDWLCALMVESAAFFPAILWARKIVRGMPIMPVFAMVCLVYYGLPFVNGHPLIYAYDSDEKVFAAATVAAVLIVMTVIWAFIAQPAPPAARVIRTLSTERGAIRVLMGCLAMAIVFQSNLIAFVISPSAEVYGVARAVLLTLGLLAVFCLSYLAGSGILVGTQKFLYVSLSVVLLAYLSVALYLITTMQYALAIAFGYFLGSGRVPWKMLLAFLAVVTVLQAGKMDTRIKYWESDSPVPVTSLDLMVDWFSIGLDNLLNPSQTNALEPVPVLQRTSLMHMLLKTQTEAPDPISYLEGSSYSAIPLLIIPRVIWPERPNVNSLLIELNQHYGLLTDEGAQSTSIGWGMIAEANANFGLLGCIAIAIAMGMVVGFAQKFGGGFTVLSARGMAGLLVMSTFMSAEASAAQFLTILAQSFVPLFLLTWTAMESREVIA